MSEEQNKQYQQVQTGYPSPYYYYPPQASSYYSFYNTRQYPPQQSTAQQTQQQQISNVPGMLPLQQSYIENILRLNRGKEATVYMTFENNEQWNAQVFRGVIEAAGRDHLILSDPRTGKRYLLLMVYLDYVTFDEEINYQYPGISTYQPR